MLNLNQARDDLASKWRERACEMRALALSMSEPEARVTLSKLAELYDHLGDLKAGICPREIMPGVGQYASAARS